MRKAFIAAMASALLIANYFSANHVRAAPNGGCPEQGQSFLERAQYPYSYHRPYYDAPYPPRRIYPPSIYYAPQRYDERRASPYYAPRVYDYEPPVYVEEPARPRSCGKYHYWNGAYCADARYERPYVGPKW